MRLVPDSIAGRMSWLLVAGFIVTAALTFIVSNWDQTSHVLNRIATIASVVNRVPAGTRAELLAAINESGLTYAWSSQSEPPMLMHNFMSHHLARDIRVTLANPHLFQVVAGYSRSASDTGASITPPRLVQVWIRLVDGTWLKIMLNTQRIGAFGRFGWSSHLLCWRQVSSCWRCVLPTR